MENLIDQHREFLSLIDEMSNEDFSLFNEVENQDDEHQDMHLNIDDMSYEELLQLGERIGSVSIGLSKETIAIQLKTKLFSPSPIAINLEELPPEEDGENNSFLICQDNSLISFTNQVYLLIGYEEFKDQEKIGVIKCKHEYHADCIHTVTAFKE
ncbi:probable E3 ubiquitin-protein ligase ZFP1 [Lathyrus oleraceus]|uniref:probable E3 ubiquitin-protein ligase ZFP1 n=1 Tax=Pisum sativum TaxID=3888 RepID=UPI0021CDF80F|nr:probable E3 ubiquitin-protein ligase ZFP1 [Pisum sativum]